MSFFFFNDTATTEIYTLSLHDALPIYRAGDGAGRRAHHPRGPRALPPQMAQPDPDRLPRLHHLHDATALGDRKSTRLNSSHLVISYAVFCLKKKQTNIPPALQDEMRRL